MKSLVEIIADLERELDKAEAEITKLEEEIETCPAIGHHTGGQKE